MLAKLKDELGNTVLVCVESIESTRVEMDGTEILMKGREQGVQVVEDPDGVYEACMEAARDTSMMSFETSREVVGKFMTDFTEQVIERVVGGLDLDAPSPDLLGNLGFGLDGGLGDLGGGPTPDEDAAGR